MQVRNLPWGGQLDLALFTVPAVPTPDRHIGDVIVVAGNREARPGILFFPDAHGEAVVRRLLFHLHQVDVDHNAGLLQNIPVVRALLFQDFLFGDNVELE